MLFDLVSLVYNWLKIPFLANLIITLLITKFNNKDNPQKVPELGNMITYIVNHPELLNNDTRLVQALGRFKSAKDFISLQSCNMFVHNQYVTPTASELESMVTILAPIIDAMYAIVKNEQ